MGSEGSRQYKVGWLKSKIDNFFKSEPKGVISYKKLVSAFALDTFSTERTGKEIIKILSDTGFIKLNGDNITR